MFITFDGSSATNQYLLPQTSHVELSHPSLINLLLLAEHDEKPLERYPTGWNQSDGRSLLGVVRVKGNNWLKELWECNFYANQAQVDLFNLLLQAQQVSTSVSLTDRWGVPLTKQIWLQVDRQYLTTVATNQWYRLQFQCWEI